MIIVATLGNRANLVGSLQFQFCALGQVSRRSEHESGSRKGMRMPRGRSTFNKRQKEQARQQKQRDKAERRHQRKQEKSQISVTDVDDLREHAEAQAALFKVSSDEPRSLIHAGDETAADNNEDDAKVSSPSNQSEN